MFNSFLYAWKNAFNFKGLTSRRDYWSFQLIFLVLFLPINIIVNVSSSVRSYGLFDVDLSIFESILFFISSIIYYLGLLFYLGTILVEISLSIRRLRDIGKPSYHIFFNLIPILGQLYFFYLMLQSSISEEIAIDDKSLEKKLADLLTMKNKKLITESEYNQMKTKILDL